ncbi:MAG: DUF1802 family protein [Oscillatoriophycideae cyanobacterium NC_groundwater_1537_Pr4_S-0.65um_50_18]|nr:DUF1802 family protein [Oscillatoriophycideae cyanobacterium NC_groundwater_1537_Pr4_S-0.65um_50_18]
MSEISLTAALKEWAIAIDALTQGSTILLLRKGGIREQSFAIAHSHVWLYPTYEHQKPHLLKPEYARQVVPVESGWHPATVPIQAWAEITHVFEVQEAEAIAALLPFHIWNEAFVLERLKWKARSPLSVLLLRVYGLPQPQPIPYRAEYGGCKSWIELQAGLSPEMAKPVLTEDDYRQRVEAIALLMKSVDSCSTQL